MKFNIHRSVNKTGYFLNSLITCILLKLVNDISNKFNHQYHQTPLLIMSGIHHAGVDLV